MITVKLQGGMGNQLFQYAMAKAMASAKNTSFELDLEFLLDRTPNKGLEFVFRDYDLDLFNVNPLFSPKNAEQKFEEKGWLAQVFSGFKKQIVYREPFFHYDAKVFQQTGDVYLDGYWQSFRYFTAIEDELRKDFSFKKSVEDTSLSLFEKIKSTDSICINVRRADFVNNNYHGTCDMNYFNQAIDYVTTRVANPHLFVFSDDPEWCKVNFKSILPIDIIGHEHKGYKFGNYLQLMSTCKHFIIPNSTFGWWAVWLSNTKGNIVVAPQKWFADTTINTTDLIPEHWIRFDN